MAKLHCTLSQNTPLHYFLPLAGILCLLLFLSGRPDFPITFGTKFGTMYGTNSRCSGRYIYVHKLSTKFNDDILLNCATFLSWRDMCPSMTNAGLGPRLENTTNWYNTHQFNLGLIFYNRMKNYPCLTDRSSEAAAIYVPFLAGLEVGRFMWDLNVSRRDITGVELVQWLRAQPEWSRMGGRDHFLVAGRISWDFRRTPAEGDGWGSKIFNIPEVKNMTLLDIESSSLDSNDFAIPYPTYFHPSTDVEIFAQQAKVSSLHRPWLFSFAGAPRPDYNDSIRNELINQCSISEFCNFFECGKKKCFSPNEVMQVFESSAFCLQPPGDSLTRRSTFDSMLAGCIPVFFVTGSAYDQYVWHLPRNYSRYSVLIPDANVRGGVKVEEVLRRYSESEVATMREEVIRIIPRLIYANPWSELEIVRDAFDVAVDGVIGRINRLRRGMEGR